MKRLCVFLMLAGVTSNLFAQSDFFYSKKGKEETFKIRKDIVIFKTKSQDNADKKWQRPKFKSVEIIHDDLIKANVNPDEFDVQDLADMDGVTDSYYMLEYTGDGTLQALSNRILLIPQKGESVENIIRKSGLSEKIEQLELIFPDAGIYLLTLSCKMKDILPACRRIYETGLVNVVEPDFFRQALPGNSLWPNQWNLKNTGQEGGTPGIDINVEPAWSITRGNSNIKIAIIDDGVDLTHPDLQANLLTGYDATGGNSNGSYTGNDAHGTSCAGVIGAINNSIGVVGVASGCKMIPVRAYNPYWSISRFILAFQYALNANADVINNSWGIDGSNAPALDAAVDACVNSGRNGKGCVVVFCSHNAKNGNFDVLYPANLPNVIAVGSVNCVGRRILDSRFDSTFDVVAPVGGGGDSINSTKVYTTDLQGSLGENTANGTDGDYRSDFRGTSAACPQVAGIAALVLSVNNNLTALEVRNIIDMTCRKLDEYVFTTTSASLWLMEQ
jgi:subtilisin family serine protease